MSTSLENKGSMAATIVVSRDPDRSGNYWVSGAADDVQIQLAINEAGRRGGGTVHVKQGTYDITASITDGGYNNVILEGDGWNTEFVLANGTNVNVIDLTSCSNWVIKDLKIDGNKANNPGLTDGIATNDCIHSKFENLYVVDADVMGIALRGDADGCIVNRCRIDAAGWNGIHVGATAATESPVIVSENFVTHSSDVGIAVMGADGVTCRFVQINHNHVELMDGTDGGANTHWGIGLEQAGAGINEYCTVHGNTLNTMAGPGIAVADGTRHYELSDNMIYNCGTLAAIHLKASEEGLVTGNTIVDGFDATCRGIFSDVGGSKIEIVGNYIIDTPNLAIQLKTGTYHSVVENYISGPLGSYGFGINVSDTSTDCLLEGNFIISTNDEGIYVVDSTRIHLRDNNIIAAGEEGIKFEDSDFCTARGNTIYNPASYGIEVTGGGGAENLITICDNDIIDVTYDGIRVTSINRVIINNNLVHSAANRGMYIANAQSLINGNILHDNTWEGIEVRARSHITGNYFYSNGGGGDLELGATADGTWVHENYFEDPGSGVAINIVADSDNNDIRFNNFDNCATPVADAGTGTIYETIPLYIVTYNTDSESEDGPTVDGGGEWVSFVGQLPLYVAQVMKIEIWAVSNQTDADQMLLEIEVEGGADNEPKNTHDTGVLANQQSVTVNFAAEDIIHWECTDAAVLALLGGDSVKCVARHEAVAAPDIATDADFRRSLIHIV